MAPDRIQSKRLPAIHWRLIALAVLGTAILTFVTISLIIAVGATTMAIRSGGAIDPDAMEALATVTGEVGGRWFSVVFVAIAAYLAARRAGRTRKLHGALVGIGSSVVGASLDLILDGAMPMYELPWLFVPVLCGIGGGAAAKATAARELRRQRAIRGIERARTTDELVASIGVAFESGGVCFVALVDTSAVDERPRIVATWRTRTGDAAASVSLTRALEQLIELRLSPTSGSVTRTVYRSLPVEARRVWLDLEWQTTLDLTLDDTKSLVVAMGRASHRGAFARVVGPSAPIRERNLRALASQLRLAIEKIELLERARSVAVQDERRRLAHGFHDTLAQGFASIVLHLEAAEPALASDSTRAQRHVEQARATARESLVRAREIVWGLRPDTDERLPLTAAVRECAQRFARESGIQTSLDVTGAARRLRPEIEAAVLRAAQEALTNCRKHAGASRIGVTLSYLDDVLRLDVRDDGAGFDTETLRGSPRADAFGVDSYGLDSLRQTVVGVDGRLEIESMPGDGTTLVVEVPARRFEPDAREAFETGGRS